MWQIFLTFLRYPYSLRHLRGEVKARSRFHSAQPRLPEPGVGVAACQAGADNTRRNQMLVYNEMKKGTPAPQILELLKQDPDIERRQFGILEIPNGSTITPTNNMAGFNGTGNSQSSLFFAISWVCLISTSPLALNAMR